MIDVDRIVEQLIQAGLQNNSEDVARAKMTIILSLALRDQCDDISNIIYKYENQWSKTKAASINGIEDNDPVARLIRLLFSLIHDDVRDIRNSHSNTLDSADPLNVKIK